MKTLESKLRKRRKSSKLKELLSCKSTLQKLNQNLSKETGKMFGDRMLSKEL